MFKNTYVWKTVVVNAVDLAASLNKVEDADAAVVHDIYPINVGVDAGKYLVVYTQDGSAEDIKW